MTKDIINKLISYKIKKTELAKYFNVTRQTIAKYAIGEKPSPRIEEKLYKLANKSIKEVKDILAIHKYLRDIEDFFLDEKDRVIFHGNEAFKYLRYWLKDEKFQKNRERYANYVFGHIVNFHPRFNQNVLLMKDYFNIERFPVVTIQIDYAKYMIKEFHIEPISSVLVKESVHKVNVSFTELIDDLGKCLKPYNNNNDNYRFNVYLDNIDNEFEFIINNVNAEYKKKFSELEYFDLSRMFNHSRNDDNIIGPLIEEVLENFRLINDDERANILSDSEIRAKKIVELVKMESLDSIFANKEDPLNRLDRIFDGRSKKSINKYMRDSRRELKEGKQKHEN